MKRIEKPILCVGDLGADIYIDTRKRSTIKQSTQEILQGNQIEVTSDSYTKLTGGGTVGNTSIVLSRLGESPLFLGKVGNDIFGRFLKENLDKEGVDTCWVITDNDRYTVIVIVHTDLNEDRDFFIYPQTGSAYASLESKDIRDEIFSKVGLVFTTGLNLVEEPITTTIGELIAKSKASQIPVAFDINLRTNIYGWDQDKRKVFLDIIDNCDIVFGSGEDELAVVVEEPDVFNAAKKLVKGGRIVVCKMGRGGAAVFTEKEALKMPAFPIEVKSTLAAGDTFNGGFLAAYVGGKELRECLLWGSAAAAYTIRFEDKNKSPNEEQLLEFIKANGKTVEKIERIY